MKIGLLISGKLGLTVFEDLVDKHSIEFVLTDKQSDEIIELANLKKIDTFIGNPRNNKTFDFLKFKQIEVLISINYLYIIEKDLIQLPSILAFNIHGSLLPKYRGRTPHVWAIINNEKTTGITAHIIDEGCDTGDILAQTSIPILESDTGNDILLKFSTLYVPFVNDILKQITEKSLSRITQNNELSTYFPKRTSEDGKINWDWQKERIHNWVRAQAYPYPGAFTFANQQKIIIDKIEYSEFGFTSEIPNGSIISIYPFIVKTSNGAIKIASIRGSLPELQKFDILS